MRSILLAGLLLAAGCDKDPFERPGTVASRGFNDANLRAMVANPADLERGTGARTARGGSAAAAIDRLQRGQQRPLDAAPQGFAPININMTGGQDAAR